MRCAAAFAIVSSLPLLAAPGCDTNGRFNMNLRYFRAAQTVSAWPAVHAPDGSWARQCDPGPVDGVLVDVTLLGTASPPLASKVPDQDSSIRPGDAILRGPVDGSRSGDPQLTGTTYLQVTSPGLDLTLEDTRYLARTADRSVGHDILFLLDVSGSTSGFVDVETFRERPPGGDLGLNESVNLNDHASDLGAFRLAAIRGFIQTLNPADRVGVAAFGEQIPASDHMAGLCLRPEAEGLPWQDVVDTCFGPARKESIVDSGQLLPVGSGRSTLWQAVRAGREYLEQRAQTGRSSHLIVLSDGPDTCVGASADPCLVPCQSAVAGEVIAELRQADVHLHVVQMESLGYPGPDSLQHQASCVTGGHYRFIDTNRRLEAADGNPIALTRALQAALSDLRSSLMGHWRVAAAAPAALVESGDAWFMDGAVTVMAGSGLVTELDERFDFWSETARGPLSGLPLVTLPSEGPSTPAATCDEDPAR